MSRRQLPQPHSPHDVVFHRGWPEGFRSITNNQPLENTCHRQEALCLHYYGKASNGIVGERAQFPFFGPHIDSNPQNEKTLTMRFCSVWALVELYKYMTYAFWGSYSEGILEERPDSVWNVVLYLSWLRGYLTEGIEQRHRCYRNACITLSEPL